MAKTTRDPQEVVDVFEYNISMLKHLCAEFDNGRTESALWIAVILRTLLYTHYNTEGISTSLSIIDQLKEMDSKYDFAFLSTSFPCPEVNSFAQGWQLGDDVCGIHIATASVYAGLIVKTIRCSDHGVGYIADMAMKAAAFEYTNHWLPLDRWMAEIVFCDNSNGIRMSRLDVIRMIANKDGGAHFDPNVPVKYDTFRHPELFTVHFGETEVPFSSNPVYLSVRQIAWEVLESVKRTRYNQ